MNERQRALQLLQRIEREESYASLLLIGESGFVRTAVLGVLRWRSRLDFAIEQLAKRPLRKLEPSVIDVLRLGIYQLMEMGAPSYAIVSETVQLAPQRARGLVNAVLRRATAGALPEPDDVPTRTAHPVWLLKRWSDRFGAERAVRIAEANQQLSYPDVLSLGGDPPPDAQPSSLAVGMWKLHGASAELPRDRFHPMDEGSAVIAAIARACGDRILDLAAAPGGKTVYMTWQGASVVSNDISISRLRSLASRHRSLVVSDGRSAPFSTAFPVVLLDAPCSATGTIRKNPEIKWRLREDGPASFAPLQRELLRAALLLSSRYVVYSTCSLEPEENDEIVDGYEREDITRFVPDGARMWVENGALRLTPESGADGFTAFVLKKR